MRTSLDAVSQNRGDAAEGFELAPSLMKRTDYDELAAGTFNELDEVVSLFGPDLRV